MVEQLQRCGDLTVFKMAVVRHFEFLKFIFLNLGAVKKPVWHHHTKFCKDWSSHCGGIMIFVIFKMAAAAIMDFPKFEIITVTPL